MPNHQIPPAMLSSKSGHQRPGRSLGDIFAPAALAVLVMLCVSDASAALPTDALERSTVIGNPVSLMIQPAEIEFSGGRAMQQILVTGKYGDGSERDLTRFCTLHIVGDSATVDAEGRVVPRQDGDSVLVAEAAGRTGRVHIKVRDFERPRPISFRQDVIAALNVGGCNQGTCHGTPSGKNGFRLSLRGFDPDSDYLQLTRDVLGRRVTSQDADASLILLKALGRVAHEGGKRFGLQAVPAQVLRGWLDEGSRADPAGLPRVKHVQILPGSRVLRAPAKWQQLAVLAHLDDGSVRDITRLTVFSSSDNSVAEVDRSGLVEFRSVGEVAILCRYIDEMQAVRLSFLEPKSGFVWSNPPEHNYIDRHVHAKLKLLNLLPSELCGDHEFVRRAYLDAIGTIPTVTDMQTFLADGDKDKRAKLVDRLLQRPEYADYWTQKWMDVLRNSRATLQMEGVKAYHTWLREHFANNTPFDQVVRELLTATGNSFTVGPVNYFRVARLPEDLSETTAQLFFGVRMQCAKCHNHPFEKWRQDDYYSLAAFFAGVKQKKEKDKSEVVSFDRSGAVKHPRTGQAALPRFLGDRSEVGKDRDRREALAQWLTAADNPFFARAVVNRIWFHLTGQGIVDPVDDFRDSNPPANDELLDALAQDFVERKFDVKHIIATIMKSRTYQLSALSNDFNRHDSRYFSHVTPKLLSAERLLDAISAVTEVPEKFSGMPEGTRAIQLLDTDSEHPFLKAFGQPARQLACECERGGDATLAQALALINSRTLGTRLSTGNNRIARLITANKSDEEILHELYLATLSRVPTQREQQVNLLYVRASEERRQGFEDVQWALFNTKEFLFRH